MTIRIGKVLVVDGDEKTRSAANHLLLGSARQPFDFAGSLLEAVELLKANNYVCVFTAGEIPALPGAQPRRQDAVNLLDEMDHMRGAFKPPVVCMWHEMPDITMENFACWVSNMTLKGVVKWVRKPFPSGGGTPDRVLKKILDGQYIRLVKAEPLTPAELMAAPLQAPAIGADQATLRFVVDGDAVGSGLKQVDARDLMAKLKGAGLASKLRQVFGSKGCRESGDQERAQDDQPEAKSPATQSSSPPTVGQWAAIPNEPIGIVDFMVHFCEARTKENRLYRKRALMAAARHERITLPPPAEDPKHGQTKKYFVHDLLAVWPQYIDKGVDLPPLLSQPDKNTTAA